MRLDNELVNRKLFDTRNKAQNAIKEGIIKVDDKVITKSSYEVSEESKIEIAGEVMPYVSRGGLKLEKAINVWNVDLKNKTMLDIGSSTGGFTDCALQNGAKKVIAVDVGSDQMDKKLRDDSRVDLHENTDFRTLNKDLLDEADFASIDVSFISVTKIIDVFKNLTNLKEVVCLVKPQFECGIEVANKYKGVINDKEVHKKVINTVISAFCEVGYGAFDLTSSPIKGGSGNTEYLLHLYRTEKEGKVDTNYINSIVNDTFSTK